jgi:hypothetical protein
VRGAGRTVLEAGKGLELAKVARRDDQCFDCANWLHRACALPKEDFRRAVGEEELTGREEEPAELIYFKVYKSQIPVTERAIEMAALMLARQPRPAQLDFTVYSIRSCVATARGVNPMARCRIFRCTAESAAIPDPTPKGISSHAVHGMPRHC